MQILLKHLPVTRSGFAGLACSLLASLFLIADAFTMVFAPEAFESALEHIAYPPHHLPYLAGVVLLGVGAYLTRRLAALGCALLTAFLGGAIASHVRIGEVLSPPVLICGILGLLLWAGWLLRSRSATAQQA